LERRFAPLFEQYVIAAYSHPPLDMPELEARLEESVSDEALQMRILEAVRKGTNPTNAP
jgi:hypothetical protein